MKRLVLGAIIAAVVAAAAWYAFHAYQNIITVKADVVPAAKVIRGDVTLAVTARGELRGGNPMQLSAPSTGGDMHIVELRTTGTPIRKGEVVAQFDTTEQEFKLREAQADVAEAEQHLLQAKAQRDAQDEEDKYALLKAQTDERLAELDEKKNPLLPPLTARQNTLALAASKDHLIHLEHNLANRKATGDAGIAIQEAGRGKADSQAKTAQRNIDAMILRAPRDGYVSIRQNTTGNFAYDGMILPFFQVGDLVRPGMTVAEIPDLRNWEISTNIAELDRGHLALGQKVAITIIAVPAHPFAGHVKDLGGTSGPFWDRHFECKIALDNPVPELRPGMSAQIVVTTDEMKGVLSLPAQALFESDGRSFVYVHTAAGFTPKDVTLVRRNEMRVVVTGVNEGQEVALANPTEFAKKDKGPGAATPQPLHK